MIRVIQDEQKKKQSKSPTCTISEEIGRLLSDSGTSPQAKESILERLKKSFGMNGALLFIHNVNLTLGQAKDCYGQSDDSSGTWANSSPKALNG